MNETMFCYWLQGYSELCGETPSPEQWKMIQDHLRLVFKNVTKQNPAGLLQLSEVVAKGGIIPSLKPKETLYC